MLRQMSSNEFLDWSEYSTREPFGMWWMTQLFARFMQLIANIFARDPKKQEPYKMEEFVLEIVNDRPFRTQTWQQQKQIVKMLVAGWNKQYELQQEHMRRLKGES